nr:FUN14 domain-containing protein 1-like [Onthophagus taurus]
MKNVKSTFSKLGGFGRNSHPEQLLLGVVLGYATGYVTMKVGRKAALVVGTGVLAFQIAQNFGFTKSNWDDARNKAKAVQSKMGAGGCRFDRDKFRQLIKKNTSFVSSFAGGFLIAFATV